jgi:ketosteroid isomerase-like protein
MGEGAPRQGRRRSHVSLRKRHRGLRSCAPLQYRGANAYRENWQAWFSTFQDPIGYELRDLKISADKDLAFCHSFNRITGKRTDGETTDVWVRTTFCCRRLDGQWKIVHEHQSVPFYMDGSYRAAIDLNP